MPSTRLTRHIEATPSAVYRALIDAEAVQEWMVPEGMTSTVHFFEGREGGTFRISLRYDTPTGAGKTDPQTDTFHGRFVELVPHRKVVQVVEFESEDPSMSGEQRITYVLEPAGDGTDVEGTHENLPSGLRPEDNETGWRMSLDKLARLVE